MIEVHYVAAVIERADDANDTAISGPHRRADGTREVSAHMARRDRTVELPPAAESTRYAGVARPEKRLCPESRRLVRARRDGGGALRFATDPRGQRGIGLPPETRGDTQSLDRILTARSNKPRA